MFLAETGVSRHVWPLQVNADSINDISAYASDQDKFSPGMPNDLLPVNCIASARTSRTVCRFSQHALGPALTFKTFSEHKRKRAAMLRIYASA